jgi:hypothetical protein
MAQFERVREAVTGKIDAAQVAAREQQGWRLVALEWERGDAAEGRAAGPAANAVGTVARREFEAREPVPYGARVADDCRRLEDDADEMQFLLALMELIIQDISISKVAEELNRKGFRTRGGTEWGPVSVFNLLPRLIELTPKIFASQEWVERRRKLTLVY